MQAHRKPYRRLRAGSLLIGAAVLLVLGTWFSGTAVAPSLRQEWGIDTVGVATLTVAVQLGFAAAARGPGCSPSVPVACTAKGMSASAIAKRSCDRMVPPRVQDARRVPPGTALPV